MIKTLFFTISASIALVFSVPALCGATGHSRISQEETAEPVSAAKRLGLGYEAVRYLGKPERALSLLYNLENEIPELKNYVFFIRGRAFEKLKNPLAAQTYMKAEFHPSSLLRTKALEGAAGSLERHGFTMEAQKIYKTLLNSGTASRKDFYLKKTAELAAGTGHDGKAADSWKLLWTNHPESPFAQDARDEVVALGFEFFPSEKDREARADRLFKLRKWKKAGAEYESLPRTPERNVRRAVCIYMTGRKNPEKLKRALALLKDAKSAEGLYRKAEMLERLANISDNRREKRRKLLKAADAFKAVYESFPDSKRSEKSLFKAQKINLKSGNTDDAENIYNLIKKSHPPLLARAAWNLGWAYYKKGEYKKAVRIFSENRRPENSVLSGQFSYWTARIFEKTGRKSEAQSLFLEVASKKQFSYYSFLALKKTGSARSFSEPDSKPGTADADPGIKKARLLLEAGLGEWAAQEARAAGKSSPVAACKILSVLKRFNSCIKLVGNYPRPEMAKLSFPKGFEREVKKFSAKYGLDETLVYSLIREESRFNRTAVSHANAFGLMQLIMPTAKEVARKTGSGTITREKLFSPELNIKLGSHYLATLTEKFKGNSVTALAGYNAGPSRVKRWTEGPLKNLEPDEFTEDIPFTETRNYVRRIFRSYGAYKTVYGPSG